MFNRIVQPLLPLTGHSFRRGYIRLAFIRGVPIWQVMHHGDWKSMEVAMSYAEDALIPNPLGGLLSMVGIVPKLSATPGRVESLGPVTPGAHNEEIYCGRLGLSREDLAALGDKGVI